MIELIVIWRLSVNIGRIAAEKGLKKFPYQLMAVLLWILGEFSGGGLAYIVLEKPADKLLTYAFCLVGAVLGAVISFQVMHYVPELPEEDSVSRLAANRRVRGTTQFRRSAWVPTCAILATVGCLGATYVTGIALNVRARFQQVQVSHPVVGTQVDDGNRIVKPLAQIDAQAEAIYLGFTLVDPSKVGMTITIDIQVDGKPAYTYSKKFEPGQVMTVLERSSLGIDEFPRGTYTVKIRAGSYSQADTSFIIQ